MGNTVRRVSVPYLSTEHGAAVLGRLEDSMQLVTGSASFNPGSSHNSRLLILDELAILLGPSSATRPHSCKGRQYG